MPGSLVIYAAYHPPGHSPACVNVEEASAHFASYHGEPNAVQRTRDTNVLQWRYAYIEKGLGYMDKEHGVAFVTGRCSKRKK